MYNVKLRILNTKSKMLLIGLGEPKI